MQTVLTVKELSDRWNIPVSTIYDLIKEEKLPILPVTGTKRILLSAVEQMERESEFNPRSPRTMYERKLKRELEEKEEEVLKLKSVIAKIQAFSTEVIFNISVKN